MRKRNISAVILAGGEGTRLRPITENIPKPLVPIGGRPCITLITELLYSHGIEDIYITLGHKAEMIKKLFETEYSKTGRRIPSFVVEEKPLGTAGSVLALKDVIKGDFIVIGGDCVCDFDLGLALDKHYASAALATVLLSSASDPREYGVAVTEGDRISRFIEKPGWSRVYSNTVNTGIYIFNEKIFDYIVVDNEGKCDFAKDVFSLLFQKGLPLNACPMDGYWKDVGDKDSYLCANKDALAGRIKTIPQKAEPFADPKVIEPSFIGKNVTIGASKVGPYAIIGDNSIIGDGCRIVSSVLFSSVVMKNGSEAKNAVICSDSVLGEDASADDGAVVGYGCNIGSGSVISADSVLYSGNSIPSGVKVAGNIKCYTKDSETENGTLVIKGENCEITCLKAGNAFGRIMNFGDRPAIAVGVASCGGDSRFFALISGITASGCGVYNTGIKGKSALRYVIRKFGLNGGICISESESEIDGKKCVDTVLTFYGKDGMPVSREQDRKLSSNLSSYFEKAESCGFFKQFSGFSLSFEKYITAIFEGVDKPVLGKTALIAPDIVRRIVSCSDNDGLERIIIGEDNIFVYYPLDKNGVRKPYPRETIDIILSFVIGIQTGSVVIPYDYSFICEVLGKRYGYTVRRATLEDKYREDLYYITDPVIAGTLLIRYLGYKKMTFGDVCDIIPAHGSEVVSVDVADGNIGKVMLSLIEQGSDTELVDGVKIFLPDKDGTVLITPEKRRNSFRIYAEALKSETAKELCGIYKDFIEKNTLL